MTEKQLAAIRRHGEQLLALFPNATEQDPVKLCKKLRLLEAEGNRIALRLCNGPEYDSDAGADSACALVLHKVNKLLGNVHEYQPKTGAKCGCKRGVQRDNCSACEGTGYAINFAAIRARKPLVPIFVNRDPRGYALKIRDDWMTEHKAQLHKDWGGYGIIAPDIGADGHA